MARYNIYENGCGGRTHGQSTAIVVEALKQAGYVPFDQLTGYVRTNNLSYITRQGHARELVSQMDPSLIRIYLQKTGKSH